jgi:hypothetical protein
LTYEDNLIIDQIQGSIDKKFSDQPIYKLISFHNNLKNKVQKAEDITKRAKIILNIVS